MNKILRIVISLIFIVPLLAACQATPEKPVVIQKDMEQMIEKAKASDKSQNSGAPGLRERLSAPDIYTANFEGYNGGLTVNANAAVTIPDSSGISAMRVSRHYFTQEEADRMMKVFLQGEALYKAEHPLTKAEIQDKLVQLYAMRDLPEAGAAAGISPDASEFKEKLQKDIEYYESMYAGAPETTELIPAETTFHPSDGANNPDARVIEGISTVNGKLYYLLINNGYYNENNVEAVFTTAGQSLDGSYSSSAPNYTILYEEDMLKIQVPESFTMVRSEAQSAAEALLAEFGMAYMVCVDIDYAAVEKFTPGMEPEYEKWAYSLQFQRTVNGIPITLTGYTGVSTDNEMSVPWPFERLNIIIDETGVVSFYHTSPCSVEDTLAENAAMLDFPEVVSVFEKMLPISFAYLDEEEADYRLQVDITEVRLGLMRITGQNSRDSGLLIPVWDFFGKAAQVIGDGESHATAGAADTLLTINAIDGAIIDRSLGY